MEIVFNEINEKFTENLQNINFTNEIKEKFYEVGYSLYLNMKGFYNNREMPVSHYVYFLIENSTVVGYCSFYCNNHTNFSELFALYIDEKFRGNHFTYDITKDVMIFLKKQNIKKIKIPLTKDSDLGIYILGNFFEKLSKEENFTFEINYN